MFVTSEDAANSCYLLGNENNRNRVNELLNSDSVLCQIIIASSMKSKASNCSASDETNNLCECCTVFLVFDVEKLFYHVLILHVSVTMKDACVQIYWNSYYLCTLIKGMNIARRY